MSTPLPLNNDELSLLASLVPYANARELARITELVTGTTDEQRARASFHEFVRQAWHVVEPGVTFIDNWHIAGLCRHLERMVKTPHAKALWNMPPGCMKSLLVCVMFPAWVWIDWPGARFFHGSYGESLSLRDSRKCRDLVQSDWYVRRWGHKIRSDINQVKHYETVGGGWRMSSTVGGQGTGHHPDFIIVDDPHNTKEAESNAERQHAIRWWSQTMSSRGVVRGARRLIVMQRLHEDDLSNHVIRSGGYEHICLPMRFEPGRMQPTTLGWEDERKEAGELLWPAAFPEEAVANLEGELGPYGSAGQLQQRPAPLEGGMFKREWFEVVAPGSEPSSFDRLVRAWDLAHTAGSGDNTAGVLMGRTKKEDWVLHCIRGQWGSGDRDDRIELMAMSDAEQYGAKVRVWLPQDPSAGKTVAEYLGARLNGQGYSTRWETVTRNKIDRANQFASRAWEGWKTGNRVKVVDTPASREWMNELLMFPNGTHDDFVDATSDAYSRLANQREFKVIV